MTTSEKRFSDFLAHPPGGLTGVVTLLGFGVLDGLVASALMLYTGKLLWPVVLAILAILALLWGLYAGQRQLAPMRLVPTDQQPDKFPALIVLVSKGRPTEPDRDPIDQAAKHAIAYHLPTLKTCWLVASGGERGSHRTAENLVKAFEHTQVQFHIRVIDSDFPTVQQSYDLVRSIYEEELDDDLSPLAVIADFTGGTKPMSVGMVMACGARLPMQYMYGHRSDIASQPRTIELKP